MAGVSGAPAEPVGALERQAVHIRGVRADWPAVDVVELSSLL